jgi:hypothetical protein
MRPTSPPASCPRRTVCDWRGPPVNVQLAPQYRGPVLELLRQGASA